MVVSYFLQLPFSYLILPSDDNTVGSGGGVWFGGPWYIK